MSNESIIKTQSEELAKRGISVSTILTSIATAVILMLLTWVGSSVSSNSEKLTTISTSLPYVQQSVADLKATVSTLVTRGEMDFKISSTRAEYNILADRDKQLIDTLQRQVERIESQQKEKTSN